MRTIKRSGLTSSEARACLSRVGPNEVFRPSRVRFWAIAREEITEPMILLLLVVGVAYSLWGQLVDAATIFAVILVLVFVEIYNEFRAKRAIAALERIAAPKARVVRDGEIAEIDTDNVVPNDLLVLAPGTRIPADAKVTETRNLACDESALTGESFPVEKSVNDTLFAGTVIIGGEGEAIVTATGKATRLGGIGRALEQVSQPRTPLQLAMKALAGKLVWVAAFFAVLIPAIGILQGQDYRQMILTGLSLAFATIPEELPIIITMVLGLGSYALSRSNFLVKRIRAAETLGDVTVIVTDKTGTITESRMHVAGLFPEAQFAAVLQTALANVSEQVVDPLERALVEAAEQRGSLRPTSGIVRVRLVGNGRKTKSTLRRDDDGTFTLFISGAPEEVVGLSRSKPTGFDETIHEETKQGRRLVAVAFRDLSPKEAALGFDRIERDFELVGIVSFEDPPRAGVKETIARAASAGIRTIVVTGDHPATAASIAAQVGISADRVVTGNELDHLPDEVLERALQDTSVFARTTPEHKYRIVKTLQRAGEVVAVTGDGVNDALALKAADVGIAMGTRGTDVAKEAAQVVLADDNYITITHGVFEGRKFYDNLKKGVTYYLSVKLGLILIFLLPVIAGLPLPFSPIQIIVLELFMDLAASAGFVAEPAEKVIFERRPRRREAVALLDRSTMATIALKGLLLFAAVMAGYGFAKMQGASDAQVQTAAFTAWMVGHVALALISRSETQSILAVGLFRNRIMVIWACAAVAFLLAAVYVPWLQDRFKFSPISLFQFLAVAAIAVAITSLAEPVKRWR